MKPFARTAAVIGCAIILLLAPHRPAKADPLPQDGCGNEGEQECPLAILAGRNPVCDTALQSGPTYVCGCVLRGPFGGCLIKKYCANCVNATRRVSAIGPFVNSWIDWALRNQRGLAQDEPLNWVMHLGTHNSFNSINDGHADLYGKNQYFTMTDQLRSGARILSLDLHYFAGNSRLCHSALDGPTFNGLIDPLVCLFPGNGNSYGAPGARFYAQGIGEIRNWLSTEPDEIVILDLEDYTVAQGGTTGDVELPLLAYLPNLVLNPLTAPLSFGSSATDRRWPTRRELLAAGKRVVVLDNHLATDSVLISEREIVGGFTSDWYAKNLRQFPDCPFAGNINAGNKLRAALVVEEREAAIALFGSLDAAGVASAAECNYNFIILDHFSEAVGLDRIVNGRGLPSFSRQEAAVWSWKSGDTGQHGDCAMLESASQRWVSSNCAMGTGRQARFACAFPRSESGLDPLRFSDPVGDHWKVTNAAGTWEHGPDTCQEEFGQGYVFSVPVNGYQNRRLRDAAAGKGDVWLNYSQKGAPGKWVIARLPQVNKPPVALAVFPDIVECGSAVTLDGSDSSDPDFEQLASYTWTGPFGTLNGRTVSNVVLPLGTHSITLTVTDPHGATDTDSGTITVRDTTPPSMTLSLEATYPSPRSGKVPVTATIHMSDSCDTEPPSVDLVSIFSNKPFPGDVQDAKIGADDREFKLDATTQGKTYTVTYRATDLSGNSTRTSAQITVVKPR